MRCLVRCLLWRDFLNITHLKYALEIAQTGSLNKAAENLYMGQPNLSRAIKELEASLGITIFDRSAKGMVVTPEGEQFLQYAKQILEKIEAVEAIYRDGAPVNQRFTISVPHSRYIAEAFACFSKQLDETLPIELSYREDGALSTIQLVTDSECKLGIIRFSAANSRFFKNLLDEKGLSYEIAAEFDAQVTMSASNPLAGMAEIAEKDLKNMIEVAYSDAFAQTETPSKKNGKKAGHDTSKLILVSDRASLAAILLLNHGTFAVTEPMPAEILEKYDLLQKNCSGKAGQFKDMLIYRKGYRLTELDNLFITELCGKKRKYL